MSDFKIIGIVTQDGNPIEATVRSYNRSTGELHDEVASQDSDGMYVIDSGDSTTSYYIVALNDDRNFNARIHDKITGQFFPDPGSLGIFMGGYNNQDAIYYYNIDTLSDWTYFGDLTLGRERLDGCSNGINNRAVAFGGYRDNFSQDHPNTIDYFTITSPGNAIDFGDTTIKKINYGSTSNGVQNRGITMGGQVEEFGEWNIEQTNIIDYITITSLGNAAYFGDVYCGFISNTSCTSNGSNNRGIMCGGNSEQYKIYYDGIDAGVPEPYPPPCPRYRYVYHPPQQNIIDYITITSPGNSAEFGTLRDWIESTKSLSNGMYNRALITGGYEAGGSKVSWVDYINILTGGDASNWGSLTSGRFDHSATSNGTNNRGIVMWGGPPSTSYTNYLNIMSLGSAVNYTTLGTSDAQDHASTSNGVN